MRWQNGQTAIDNTPNENGRLGAGATSHCAHGNIGDVLREYLDWRPFSYYTNRMTPIGSGFIGWLFLQPCMETTEFIPLENGGTLIQFRMRIQNRSLLARLRFWFASRLILATRNKSREALQQIMVEDGVLPAPG